MGLDYRWLRAGRKKPEVVTFPSDPAGKRKAPELASEMAAYARHGFRNKDRNRRCDNARTFDELIE